MKLQALTHQFAEHLPEILEEGVLYISIKYTTAAHKCCCGCGQEVVTPLSPTDWKLIFDGVTVSLSPSIGNWSFLCRSHYWIKRNKVEWSGDMSLQKVEEVRARDRIAKERHYGKPKTDEVVSVQSRESSSTPIQQPSLFGRFIAKLKALWRW